MNSTGTNTKNAADVYTDAASIWMLRNGSAKANVSELDPALLHPFEGHKPPSNAADITKNLMINQTGIVTWVMDGYPYSEATTPIIYGNASDKWLAPTTMHFPLNSTIDIIMRIANDSMDMVSYMHARLHSSRLPAALGL